MQRFTLRAHLVVVIGDMPAISKVRSNRAPVVHFLISRFSHVAYAIQRIKLRGVLSELYSTCGPVQNLHALLSGRRS